MVKEKRRLAKVALHFFELLMVVASFYLAFEVRPFLPEGVAREFVVEVDDLLWILPVAVAIWSVLLWFFGLYRDVRTTTLPTEIGRLFKVVFVGTLAIFAISYMARTFDVSRAFIAIFAALNFCILAVHRMIVRSVFRHHVKRGYDRVFVIVAGTGKMSRRHAELIRERDEWGLEIVGFVAETPDLAIDSIAGLPILGTIGDLPSIIQNRVVDEVHFAVSRRKLGEIEDIVRACDETGVRVRIALSYFSELNSRIFLEHLGGEPLLTFSSSPHNEYTLFVKRVMDIVLSFMALIIISPMLLLVMAAIKATSRGPVIFRQARVGMSGRIFKLYKFRTMIANAEAMKKDLMHLNEMDGPVFKIKNDPRITRVGRFLRKTSIDELPQLWNVLRGDMSFVGPRPPVPDEVKKYERWQRRRLSMRPGLTSLWQIKGRNKVDFKRWMELDMEYIDNWSILLDVKIFLKTIPVVLIGRGAS